MDRTLLCDDVAFLFSVTSPLYLVTMLIACRRLALKAKCILRKCHVINTDEKPASSRSLEVNGILEELAIHALSNLLYIINCHVWHCAGVSVGSQLEVAVVISLKTDAIKCAESVVH